MSAFHLTLAILLSLTLAVPRLPIEERLFDTEPRVARVFGTALPNRPERQR